MRVARIAHRLAATGVLVLVVSLLPIAWTQEPAWTREGTLALAALAVAAGLAVLGIVTPGSRLPAVTLGNLLGGYVMLALLAAIVAASTPRTSSAALGLPPIAPLHWMALAALGLTFAQAALGATISAQYALTACPTLGACPGLPLDGFALFPALDPFRPLTIADGRVVPPPGAAAAFVIHRAFGIVVVIAALWIARRLRGFDRRLALALAALAVATPLAGIATIFAVPSLPLTLLHNACAALVVAVLAAAAMRLRTLS